MEETNMTLEELRQSGRYQVYTVPMEKYGLKLHQSMEDVPGREAWLEWFGPDFLAEGNMGYYGYAYDDGTCAFDGDADLGPDYSAVSYQFRYSRKGYLDTVSPASRLVFLRRYWYCDGVAEIAAGTGYSQSKVKSLLHRTRRGLKEHLRKEGYDL